MAYFPLGDERRRLSDYENDYKKPSEQDSSRDCFRVAQRLRKSFVEHEDGTKTGCMACDPTIGAPDDPCPRSRNYDCQYLVDQLFKSCRGEKKTWPWPDEKPKTAPPGYFFDPEETLSGTWSESIESALKIKIERCGCNSAFGIRSSSFLFFMTALGLMFYFLLEGDEHDNR